MSEQRNHKNYSLEDIEQYLQGKLSPAEMHELEKAAVQDPFLADAIEGYQSTDLSFAKNDLSNIHRQLSSGPAKIIPSVTAGSSWLKIAASIILVAGAGVIGWKLFSPKNNTKQELAVQQQPVKQIPKDTIVIKPHMMEVLKALPKTAILARAEPKVRQENILKEAENSSKPKAMLLTNNVTVANATGNNVIVPAQKNDSFNIADIDRIRVTELSGSHKLVETTLKDNTAKQNMIPGSLSYTIKKDTIRFGTDSFHLQALEERVITLPNENLVFKKTPKELTNTTVIVGRGRSDLRFADSVAASKLSPTSPVIVNSIVEMKNVEGGPANFKLQGRDVKPAFASQQGKGVILDTLMPLVGWEVYKNYLRNKLGIVSFDTKRSSLFVPKFRPVELRLTFNNTGKVVDVKVISSFDPSLNDKLIKAIKEGSAWNIYMHWVELPLNSGYTLDFSLTVTIQL